MTPGKLEALVEVWDQTQEIPPAAGRNVFLNNDTGKLHLDRRDDPDHVRCGPLITSRYSLCPELEVQRHFSKCKKCFKRSEQCLAGGEEQWF